jgi:low temperature requirement protein LtrA
VSVRAPLVSASVTTWEIFFDLIFVFTVGRLADLVLGSATAAGYVQALVT